MHRRALLCLAVLLPLTALSGDRTDDDEAFIEFLGGLDGEDEWQDFFNSLPEPGAPGANRESNEYDDVETG